MKALKICGVGALVLLLGGLAYAAYFVRSLDTPEFKRSVIERARAAIGTDLQVRELSISVLSGVTLRGVTIANPAGFPGQLLTADAFVLRYRLWPLLRGQFQVERLSLDKPVLTLAANARGTWNYERIGAPKPTSGKSPPSRGKRAAPAPSAPGAAPALQVELMLSRLALEDAEIVMLGDRNAPLAKVSNVDLATSLKLAGTAAEGTGKASFGTLNLADALFVRDLAAPIQIVGDKVQLDPIRGDLAGGTMSGVLTVRLKGGLGYAVNLRVKRADVRKLLEEAGSTREVSGTLEGEAWFEGSGGLPTLHGKGRAEIKDCKVANAPLMTVLAELLRLPKLKNPDFDECSAEFTVVSSRLHTTALRLEGPDIQLTGRGVTSLADYSLNYDLTLALRKAALDGIPVREARAAFKDRPDGWSALDFKVSGTTDAPETDLTARIGTAAATELLKGGLGRLFGRKK